MALSKFAKNLVLQVKTRYPEEVKGVEEKYINLAARLVEVDKDLPPFNRDFAQEAIELIRAGKDESK